MINLIWLNTFCTLVDTGHFTRTVDRLFMTQSGVSQHIKKLEQQLETELLVREGKSFRLTEGGQTVFDKGREILFSAEQLEVSIKQDEAFAGNVKIGSPGSLGLKLYPKLLDLQVQHQGLSFEYSFAPNKTIEQNLIAGKFDIGLITQRSEHKDLVGEKIAEEPLVLVTSSEIKSVDWQSLKATGVISHPDAAYHFRQLLSANFHQFEHISQFNQTGFSNQISLILSPVSRGLGFTVLPHHAVRAFSQQHAIKIHDLPKPVSEDVFLYTNRYARKSKRIATLKTVVKEHLCASETAV